MPGMVALPMGGGEAMSMMWMRMPGQTWPGVAASFLAMWVAMMAAMMLPSFAPTLWRARAAFGGGAVRRSWLTVVLAGGYLFVWTVLGAAVFPAGVTVSAIAVREPAVVRALPLVVAAVVLVAGALQLTPWKAGRLARHAHAGMTGRAGSSDERAAWRHGVRLGIDCARCCVGLMVIPLAAGSLDLWVMAAVTAAITAERLAPARVRVARSIGVVCIAAGLLLIARAAGVR